MIPQECSSLLAFPNNHSPPLSSPGLFRRPMGWRDILGLDPRTGNDSLGSPTAVIAGPVPATHHDASANFAEAVEMNQHLSSFCSARACPVRSSRLRMKMLEELAEERKRTVEDVRRTLDLTTGQIWAAFAILGEQDVPSEQLAKLKQCGVTR